MMNAEFGMKSRDLSDQVRHSSFIIHHLASQCG
jgi:hypothetical protein